LEHSSPLHADSDSLSGIPAVIREAQDNPVILTISPGSLEEAVLSP
jgi:hypothetical protein